MKRHEQLQPLSREHHHALVLARALEQAATLDQAEQRALVQRAGDAYRTQIADHFWIEERELMALSACGSAIARDCADKVRDDHARLRALFESLSDSDVGTVGPELGALLREHVRFEEQSWFPGIEGSAPSEELAALAWRLQAKPESRIVDFSQDDEGTWVAALDCGHPQHVRHEPPFRQAPWVRTAAGRTERLGERLPCSLCEMPRAPWCLEEYKRTAIFDNDSLPAGLRRTHSTKAGTWGRIRVHEGRVRYVVEQPGERSFELKPGVDGVIAPRQPHRVELRPGARMQVLFCRAATGD